MVQKKFFFKRIPKSIVIQVLIVIVLAVRRTGESKTFVEPRNESDSASPVDVCLKHFNVNFIDRLQVGDVNNHDVYVESGLFRDCLYVSRSHSFHQFAHLLLFFFRSPNFDLICCSSSKPLFESTRNQTTSMGCSLWRSRSIR